jgi:Transposase DDE domain
MHGKYSADALLAPLRRHLTRPQWQNLIVLVVALQWGRTLILRQLALYLVCALSSASCYRRLARLLATDAAVFQPLQRAWVRLVLRTFAPGRGRVPLLLDWTWHRDRCRSLWIMLPVGGRAAPLAFFLAAPQLGGEGSQRLFEDQALTQLRDWLPRRRRFVLIGDRGFGSRDRMRLLQQLDFAFILRVHSETKIRVEGEWNWTALLELCPPVGGRRHWEGVWLGKWKPKERLRVNVVAVRQPLLAPKQVLTNKGKPTGQTTEATTWFLVTDLPPTTDVVALYQTRMQIEQSFRDCKAVLGLEQERTRQPWERLRVLLWGLMIGLALDLHLGHAGPAVSGAPRTGKAVQQAPPALVPRYRAESSMRAGLHVLIVQLLLGSSLLSETVQAVAAKAERLGQRPQVRERRRATPAPRCRTKRNALSHGHA